MNMHIMTKDILFVVYACRSCRFYAEVLMILCSMARIYFRPGQHDSMAQHGDQSIISLQIYTVRPAVCPW